MTPQEPTVRNANATDAKELAVLTSQLGYPAAEADCLRRLGSVRQHADENAVLVADSGEQGVIGWIHVIACHRLESEPFAELGGLVVAQGHRSQGTGRLLLAAAEAWAMQRGLGELRVRSNVVREDAHRFYQNLGYGRIKSQAIFAKTLAWKKVGEGGPKQ